VQDKDGQKMSKTKGNAVDPFEALGKFGADAIRWYFYVNSAPWLPNRFHEDAVTEGQRKFMGTLWNTYAFFVLYANIDQFDATKYKLEYDKLSVMDKWLLSKLNTLIMEVDGHLENYRIPEAARALQDFVDAMSNWYVRRSRDRFWGGDMPQDKVNAYMTLYTALVTVCKLAAPMIPFMTEDIYQNLVRSIDKTAPESIHLCDYPVAEERFVDKELERNMDAVLKAVVMGRACRNASNIKNRQPVASMFIKGMELDDYYREIIKEELNVKEVQFTDDVRAFTTYSFKPQMRTVGPKYGKLLNKIKEVLLGLDGNAAMDELKAQGALHFQIDAEAVELKEEDLLIEMTQSEGYVSENDKDITVVLDTRLTEELLEEGFVRELISKFQTMRKEAGFEVTDRITISQSGSEKTAGILRKYEDTIKSEVMAEKLVLGEVKGYTKEWSINGETTALGVEK
jgi:isoleucyl-tRNA synthetase